MSNLSNIQSDLQFLSPYLTWLANIVKMAGGNGSTTSVAAANAVVATAEPATQASFSLGLTSDVGEGFKVVTAITNLVAQRSALNNTPAMEQAEEAKKLQALKDHINAVISEAEVSGNLDGIKLLLS